MLIDPNAWSKDGATALAEWLPSENGTELALLDPGRRHRLADAQGADVATGEDRPDEIKWVKFSGLVLGEGRERLLLLALPGAARRATFQALNENHEVYFHKLGTPQSADRLVYATPERPSSAICRGHRRRALAGHHLGEGTDERYEVTLIDLKQARCQAARADPRPRQQLGTCRQPTATIFYFRDQQRRAAAADRRDRRCDSPSLRDRRRSCPQDAAKLEGASLVGGKLIATYLVDAKTEVRGLRTRRQAARARSRCPGIGTAGGFGGKVDDPRDLLRLHQLQPPDDDLPLRCATRRRRTSGRSPRSRSIRTTIAVEQRFYASKDGTRVPMFVVRRKKTRPGPAPTLLYAYGGFNISLTPGFSATRLAWMEQGGVLPSRTSAAAANMARRGTTPAGSRNKQNVFDDFIAAGEYLKRAGDHDAARRLAIQGGSNGGLLVGAVVNQRPDLFARRMPAVGVMDMLRFDRFTAGRYWVDDYGYPDKEADFRTLLAYSPYHNIKAGDALSGDAGDDRGYRRPRRARAQLQIYRGAPGGGPQRRRI